MTKGFYEYSQNNSGGGFDVDDRVCHRIVIEAHSGDEADSIAESLGVYFDGCEKGIDCDCCGDRWSRSWGVIDMEKLSKEGYEVSAYVRNAGETEAEKRWNESYGSYKLIESPIWNKTYSSRAYRGRIGFDTVEEYLQFLADEYGWTAPDARIFYLDGSVREIFKKQ